MICPNCGKEAKTSDEYCCFCGIRLKDTFHDNIYTDQDLADDWLSMDSLIQRYQRKCRKEKTFDDSLTIHIDEPTIEVISIPLSAYITYGLRKNKKKIRNIGLLICFLGILNYTYGIAKEYYNKEYVQRWQELTELLPPENEEFVNTVNELEDAQSMDAIQNVANRTQQILENNQAVIYHHPRNYVFPDYWDDDEKTEKIIKNQEMIYETTVYIISHAGAEDVSDKIDLVEQLIGESNQLSSSLQVENIEFQRITNYGNVIQVLRRFALYAPDNIKGRKR